MYMFTRGVKRTFSGGSAPRRTPQGSSSVNSFLAMASNERVAHPAHELAHEVVMLMGFQLLFRILGAQQSSLRRAPPDLR